MALKALVKSIEEIPENLRSLYAKVGDDYVLEIDEGEYKSKLSEFRGNNVNLNEDVKRLAAQLSKLEGLDPSKYEEFAAAAKELEELKTKGLLDKVGVRDEEFQKLLDSRVAQMRDEYQDQIKKLTQRSETAESAAKDLDSELRRDRVKGVISQAINEFGVARKGATQMILDQAEKVWRLDDNRHPVAMDGNQKIFGKNGDEPLTPTEWVQSLAREMPYLFEPNAGGGASGGTGKSNGATNVIDWNDQAAINANWEAIADGTVQVVGGPE